MAKSRPRRSVTQKTKVSEQTSENGSDAGKTGLQCTRPHFAVVRPGICASIFFEEQLPTINYDQRLRKTCDIALTGLRLSGFAAYVEERESLLFHGKASNSVYSRWQKKVEKIDSELNNAPDSMINSSEIEEEFDKQLDDMHHRVQKVYAKLAKTNRPVSTTPHQLPGSWDDLLGTPEEEHRIAGYVIFMLVKESLVQGKLCSYTTFFFDRKKLTTSSCCKEPSEWITYRKEKGTSHPEEQKFVSSICGDILTILQVFRRRERLLAPFSPALSRKYWRETTRPSKEQNLRPPWELPDEPHRTVTLSFDLRKSTFAMAHADKQPLFASWLDELIQILTAVTHLNCGVFGNFTGDGCIAYFLEREYEEGGMKNHSLIETESPNTVVAALECAYDMHLAVLIHLERLYGNLRYRSKQLGAGVAISLGDAYWRHDYSDFASNLIVVGPSVVDACRLCDRAKPGMILLGENAYQKLPDRLRDTIHASEFPVCTKDHPEDLELVSWQIEHDLLEREHGNAHLRKRIDDICQGVYAKSAIRAKHYGKSAKPD
ncbi:adenylate/guanylate cyclase domain-containing protein [Gimesia panareensis]|uniref:adenylate/guanylate cyclase domain-containing protein n=1 Tax=Gimesia panareensis TaxID=2527978 RepID=UPI001188A4E6|nr:adenylate/guanylate cyclase domain-containing protein [Gimesia panareensis]QDU53134.1 hypothetical protein Pan110_55180 [Gimesia panareensis]